MVLTDWLAARMIRLGWVQELDPAHLPHAFANLEQRFRSPRLGPRPRLLLPLAGHRHLHRLQQEGHRRPQGHLHLPAARRPLAQGPGRDALRDARHHRHDAARHGPQARRRSTDDTYDAAIARIQKAVDNQQIRKFTGNDYTDGLSKGDIAACVAWAGDLVQLRIDDPDIEYVFPDAGFLFSTDNLMIPNKARHKTNAERLIDYYYEPQVAAQLVGVHQLRVPGGRGPRRTWRRSTRRWPPTR